MKEKKFKKIVSSVFKEPDKKKVSKPASSNRKQPRAIMRVVHSRFLKNSITFFDKEGEVLAILPLQGGTDHRQRKAIGLKMKLKFEYYTLYDLNTAMDKAGSMWFKVDKDAKKIKGSEMKIPDAS